MPSNDMPSGTVWRKSQRSFSNGSCVGIGSIAAGVAMLSASGKRTFLYPSNHGRAFIAATKEGIFGAGRLVLSF